MDFPPCRHGRAPVVFAAVLLTLLGACAPRSDDFLLGGIQVNEPDMNRWHRTLAAEGMNALSLTVYARQLDWSGADLVFDPDALGGDLIEEMRSARNLGLEPVLVLRLALDHLPEVNRFLWHGLVWPRTEAEVDAWFYRYGEFVLEWARVAEREGVRLFGIGSELSMLTSTRPVDAIPGLEAYYLDLEKQSRERDRLVDGVAASGTPVDPAHLIGGWQESFEDLGGYLDQRAARQAEWAQQVTFGGDLEAINRRRELLERNWRRLIERVREVYSGRITYAANFDQVEQVGFWDALDVIGVNAYYPLRRKLAPRVEVDSLRPQFVQRWSEVLDDLSRMRKERDLAQPLVFTELGYTSWRGSTIEPWAGSGFGVLTTGEDGTDGSAAEGDQLVVWPEQPAEPRERALAVEALAEAAADRPGLLAGVLYWKLSTVPQHREIEPFVLILGEQKEDPLLDALRRLR